MILEMPPWEGDPVARAVDAASVTTFAELTGELLDRDALTTAGLDLLRRCLSEPRWDHCPEVALLPVTVLRDRVAREIARRSGPKQERDMLDYFRGRGELIDTPPDDASQLSDDGAGQ